MTNNEILEIEKKYPRNNKQESRNPLFFGDKISNWTILYRTNNSKSNHIQYVCQCTCGTITPVLKTSLLNHKSTSCVFCKGKIIPGQKFGKLTVISKANNQKGRGYWHCKCDCGNYCSINTAFLLSGHTRSCGCLLKESAHNRRIDLTNQRFGKLIALYPIKTNKGDKQPYWHCKCDCGNEKDIQAGALRSGTARSCGCIKSHAEENIIQLLIKNNINFQYQYSFKDIQAYKFDFYIDDTYVIEYDGIQHFKSDSGWNTVKNVQKTHKRDLLKNQYCFINEIPIIRIPYDEEYNIKDLLLNTTRFLLTSENEEEYYKGRLKC